MKTIIATLALLLFSCSAVLAADEPYDGYGKDLKLLRDHYEIKSDGKMIKASSGEAVSAARRLFSKVSFLFRSRETVLEILGDPATISAYGVKAEEKKDSPLIYRFDTGFGGSEYKLTFRQDEVVKIEVGGLN